MSGDELERLIERARDRGMSPTAEAIAFWAQYIAPFHELGDLHPIPQRTDMAGPTLGDVRPLIAALATAGKNS